MCKIQCLVTIVVLLFNFASTWDIALTVGDQLEFYENGTITNEGARFRDLTALAYDAVHNILLFVDKQSDNASIFSFNVSTKKYQALVKRKSYENIQGIAFDPITGLLFWTDLTEKSIYWKSLKTGVKDDVYGNLLLKMDEEIPRAIAVDSCRGYIYWTNINPTHPTIERARFDGSERQVIIDTNIKVPNSIAIDQRTKTLYWADDRPGIRYSIDTSDLEGKNRKTFISDIHHQPVALTISNDYIYWIDTGYKAVWQYLKDEPYNEKNLTRITPYDNKMPYALVANYRIEDQVAGVPECEALSKLSINSSEINVSFNIPRDVGIFCLRGIKVAGKQACTCTKGYVGDRCEISVCENYCFNGDCTLTAEGAAQCSCKEGYTGSRCEVNMCQDYCLNQAQCAIKDGNPVCSCSEEFEGNRCEMRKVEKESLSTDASNAKLNEVACNCTSNLSNNHTVQLSLDSSSESLAANDGDFIIGNTCGDNWDPIRDPIIMVLGTTCGLLCVTIAVLITKILKLKKRPRIKKRIIVNKNVTPLTARPDQCEITIENCCNMNICETPCFEPRSTIRPTLLDTKPGKEERKNLIANMEYPDEY